MKRFVRLTEKEIGLLMDALRREGIAQAREVVEEGERGIPPFKVGDKVYFGHYMSCYKAAIISKVGGIRVYWRGEYYGVRQYWITPCNADHSPNGMSDVIVDSTELTMDPVRLTYEDKWETIR